MGRQRLQKVIARAGLTSRRKAEGLILAGRVAVNDRVVTELGATADPHRDRITVDGEPLRPEPLRTLALHKPPGVLCSRRDRFGRPLIVDLLGEEVDERLYPAGRLDLESEGLVLMTNDGELMNAVTRPGGEVAKVYRVEVEGRPAAAGLRRLETGIPLDGRMTLPCRIRELRPGPPAELEVVLHEGRKNQIRRMFADIGHPVRRLVRVAVGPVQLGSLPPGAYRSLTDAELRALRRQAGLAAAGEAPRSGPGGGAR